MDTKQISTITVEHVVVTSHKPYEQIRAGLEERMSSTAGDMNELIEQLGQMRVSWEHATHIIEKQLGTSGFYIFSKIEHGLLLSLAGKPAQAVHIYRKSPACRGHDRTYRGSGIVCTI